MSYDYDTIFFHQQTKQQAVVGQGNESVFMEAFFGCATEVSSTDDTNPTADMKRNVRRNVWSSSLQEEDDWIDALLSLNHDHDGSVSHDRKDFRVTTIDDATVEKSTVTKDSNFFHESGESFYIPNTQIPKIIHFIWLGGGTIPSYPFIPLHNSMTTIGKKRPNHRNQDIDEIKNLPETVKDDGPRIIWNECMHSWAKYHSPSRGWIIQLWTEKSLQSFGVEKFYHCDGFHSMKCEECSNNRNYETFSSFQLNVTTMRNFDAYQHAMEHKKYGMASDILRLEILNKFGGIYVDIDYWCVDSLDDIFLFDSSTEAVQFFCGASNTGCIELNNGLLACRRLGHPILWNMMNSIHSNHKKTLEEIPLSSSVPPLILAQSNCEGKEVSDLADIVSSFFDTATSRVVECMQRQAVDRALWMEVIENTGPGLLTRSTCRWIARSGSFAANNDIQQEGLGHDDGFQVSQVAVFPSHVFHPFPNFLRNRLLLSWDTGENIVSDDHEGNISILRAFQTLVPYVNDQTKAIHLWGCSWQQD